MDARELNIARIRDAALRIGATCPHTPVVLEVVAGSMVEGKEALLKAKAMEFAGKELRVKIAK